MDKRINIFCEVDDFCLEFLPVWEAELIADGVKKRRRKSKMPELVIPMCAYFQIVKEKPTGIAFVDSTSFKVCHNIRIPRDRVFDGVAKGGKGTMGWFYGFKLHLLINHI